MTQGPRPFTLGWAEWVSLPDLGLPAIKAKIDTGAKTSALDAFQIEPFGPASAPMVRFGIHPVPGRTDITVFCSAPIVDRREVTSSNGEREQRYVIVTDVHLGGRSWPVEVTLANRETMAYRMLLGRQAIRGDITVDPAVSFLQPKLGYRLYRNLPRQELVHRPLRIALLTRRPRSASSRLLREAAKAHGHVLEPIDITKLTIVLDATEPRLLLRKKPLAHYDAVIPRLMPEDGLFGPAAVRQMELSGCFALNSGDAMERLGNDIAVQQRLARDGIAIPARSLNGTATVPVKSKARLPSATLRCLVIGGRVTASIVRRGGKTENASRRKYENERAMAERAAHALELDLASIDIQRGDPEPSVIRVSGVPGLSAFETATGIPAADTVMSVIEARVRSWRRVVPVSA